MTTEELRHKFNTERDNVGTHWPKTYEVDIDTYANVVQDVLNNHKLRGMLTQLANDIWSINIYIGPNNGPYYKGVELILKR